jgi:cyclic pyranopterin monophosphate synthase
VIASAKIATPRKKSALVADSIIESMTDLSHLDESGAPRMVDVSEKPATVRRARAEGRVLTNAETLALITGGSAPKGDVLTTARLAGILAAKRTAELIPLCHTLPLSSVDVDISIEEQSTSLRIEATVATTAQTGVEMEALTAVSVAALTVYDMLKSSHRGMRVTDIRLLEKSGGRSGDYVAPSLEAAPDAGDSSSGEFATLVGLSAEAVGSDEESAPRDERGPFADLATGAGIATGTATATAFADGDLGEGDQLDDHERHTSWPGIIPSVTQAEPSRSAEDRGNDIELQSGEAIDAIAEAVSEVHRRDPRLASYDGATGTRDDLLSPSDIAVAAPLIAGFSDSIAETLSARAEAISEELKTIPAGCDLGAADESLPWDAVRGVLEASMGPGIGLSRATKVLHRKRPALIPVIDEALMRYALKLDPGLPPEPAERGVAVMRLLKRDLDGNRRVLEAAASRIEEGRLTPLRVLELAIRYLDEEPGSAVTSSTSSFESSLPALPSR